MDTIQHNKVFLFIVILVVLFFNCEGRHHYPQSLKVADSLSDHNPDSAINYLNDLAPHMSGAPEADRMYYQLLCIKAADKAYIPHTSDSLIRPVIDYYEQGGDTRLLPVAYYYGGRVNMDLGDAPHAIGYYRKALDAMPSDTCCSLRGKILHQLGRLYWDQHLNQESLKYYTQSCLNNETIKDTIGVIFDMIALATVYEDSNINDSAISYYERAYDLATKIKNDEMRAGVCTQIGRFYVMHGNPVKARPYIIYSLSYNDKYDQSAILSAASKYYLSIGMRDSAKYFSKLKIELPNVYSKEEAAYTLFSLSTDEGKIDEAKHYLLLYKQLRDSTKRLHAAEDVARVNALYNQNVNEQKLQQSQLRDANKAKWIVILVSALILFSAFAYRMMCNYQMRIRRSKEREEAVKQTLTQLKTDSRTQIDLEKKKVTDMRNQLDELRMKNDQTTEELRKLEEELKTMESKVRLWELEQSRQEQIKTIIKDTANYRLLNNLVNTGKHPTKNEWKETEGNVHCFYPTFKNNIEKFVTLNETEYHVCLLLKMTFLPSQIQILIDKSRESVTAIRRRLFEKAFGEKGKPADWDRFIESIN